MTAIERAVKAAGGPAALARKLKLKQPQNVYNWLRSGRAPPMLTRQIARISKIPKHELRPDLYGAGK